MLDLRYGNVIQVSCALLSVTAYEWNCAAVFKQFNAVLHLPGLHLEEFRDMIDVNSFHTSKFTIFCLIL